MPARPVSLAGSMTSLEMEMTLPKLRLVVLHKAQIQVAIETPKGA